MTAKSEQDANVEQLWRTLLNEGVYGKERRKRRFFKLLRGHPRCKNCFAPFQGAGSRVARLVYKTRPSNVNPRLCNACEAFARQHQGGAEVELTLLFADVRGSTTLAESMSPTEFGKLINRFYNTATQVMGRTDALIDKIIGDQVAGMYLPGFAGPEHARKAIAAAQEILQDTGHNNPAGPWIELGVGVHTGTAYVGAVGSDEGVVDFTVLGDVANTAARLSSSAAPGEILISECAYESGGKKPGDLDKRVLELKGKQEAVPVYVLTDYA